MNDSLHNVTFLRGKHSISNERGYPHVGQTDSFSIFVKDVTQSTRLQNFFQLIDDPIELLAVLSGRLNYHLVDCLLVKVLGTVFVDHLLEAVDVVDLVEKVVAFVDGSLLEFF